MMMRLFAPLLIGAALAGCTSMPPDHGRAGLDAALSARGLQLPAQAVPGLPAELQQRPLAAADVLAVALANNPALRAELAGLGIAAADLHEAGRPANPRLSAALMVPDVGGESDKIGFGLAQDFASLLLLPARARIAEGEFLVEQERTADAVLALAAEVDRATIRLAGAMQALQLAEATAEAAGLGAELARRYHAAGNIDALTLALERSAATEARLELAAARAERDGARTELNRLMGLPAGEQRWTLDGRLALPVARDEPLEELLSLAARERLDLAAARRAVDLRAQALGLTRRYRLLGELEVGVETERETDRTRLTGPMLDLSLPLFDQGQGRVARAEAELAVAEAALRELDLDIGAAIRSAHTELAAARERASLYREELLPLRAQIVGHSQLQVNFMLRGPFDLLLAKQQEYAAQAGYVGALRDYWLARSALAREVGTALPANDAEPRRWLELEGLNEGPSVDPHAHHGAAAPEPAADPHAAHRSPAPEPAADPHAHHRSAAPEPAADPHAEHRGHGTADGGPHP